jgi:hypothetical protein
VDWKAKVDLFEQLRREYSSVSARSRGWPRSLAFIGLVRRAIGGALPPAQHYPERAKPKLGAMGDFIDQLLEEDRRAPRKQRHTARRIHRRILREFPDAAGRQIDGAQPRAPAQAADAAGPARDVCAAKLQLGTGGAGRLV